MPALFLGAGEYLCPFHPSPGGPHMAGWIVLGSIVAAVLVLVGGD